MTTLTAPFDTMTLAEHVAFCRGLRVQYANQWGESELPENKHGDEVHAANAGVNECEAAALVPATPISPGHQLPGGSTRSSRVRRQSTIPDGNPDFWRELRDFNEAHEKPVEEQGKHRHGKRSNAWLAHPGNCPDGSCLARRLRRQIKHYEVGSVRWEQARREAERYGVQL